MPARTTATRADRSMSLLVDMMGTSLDSSYELAAGRGSEERPARHRGPGAARLRAVVPLLLVLGLLTGTAAAQVRDRASEVDEGRAALVSEVTRRTAASDALARSADDLRARLAAEQAAALGTSAAGQRAAQELADLELQAGTVGVRGPGLVVRLDDAERADAETAEERGGREGEGRVLDRDLQDAVNGLWAAGAEAVSVNDQRLTALTAIRSAGEAVLVDFRPVRPPYVLRAVGPAALERRFTSGAAARRLATYRALYGIDVQVRRSGRLRLPAAGVPDLRETRPS